MSRPVRPTGWILDKSAAARAHQPGVREQLAELVGALHVCPMGVLEQLYSARSATDYAAHQARLREHYLPAPAPPDILDRALALQSDLAHHHGMWHRLAIGDLLIAEIALHHGLGVLHVDRDYDRIAEVRPLVSRRLG
ncbi:MAG: PIN domain-containing protein [Sporichthyaceae bacterium]